MFKYSQGWIKISTRAVRVLQPLVLASCEAHLPSVPQSFHSHLRAHLCLTSPQELKWRSEIASPEDYALATSMGLDAGAKCGRGQGRKKGKTKEIVQNQPQEGRRAPSILCIFAGNTSDILCVHLTPVST